MGVGSLLGDKPAGTGWSALGYTGAEQPSGSVSSRKETGRYVQLAAWQDNKEGQAKNEKPAENGLPPRPGSTSIERDNSKLKEDLDNEMGRSSDLPNFQSLSKEEFENVIKTSVQNGSVTTREIGRTITTRVYAVPFSTGNGLYYALLEHQSIESFDPEVRGPRTTIDRYRLALVVPEGYDLKTAIDLVLAPQAMVNAEKVEGTPEFALHMVPFGAAADYTCQGDLPNAGWSVAGDIAGVLTFGAGKVLRVSSKSYELSKRGLVGGLALEGSIGIYRTGEGTYLLSQGEGGQGEIAEGLLRLFGVSASLMRRKGSAALEKELDDAPNRVPPLAQLLEGHSAQQGFTGVIDSATGNVLIKPSRLGTDLPQGWVSRRGGHADVSRAIGGNAAHHRGFAVILQEDGSLRVTWGSGVLNPPPDFVVPMEFRQSIVDAIEAATGRKVSSF
jgi:hypothetical protein